MNPLLDETLSQEIAKQIKSKAKSPFDNAYRAALATEGVSYVQGFLVIADKPYAPIEHAWLEMGDRIVDPTFPYLGSAPTQLHYFPAQRIKVKQLKAMVEEAKEDYPEDDPLPIYGATPYAYYGDVMLGGKEYLEAHENAAKFSTELIRQSGELN
ncbi:MAG: hypothetical protein HY785_26170 [Oscillatoriophycideae cyanobacterium NC_groundwater_1537_Pr4_S-0.65um_50_18]|nr:hypothetical protein [Oscillatoriophycideae cyanobacterium NC_groundwater_1537_Pr4_S-0.65um_50_18]